MRLAGADRPAKDQIGRRHYLPRAKRVKLGRADPLDGGEIKGVEGLDFRKRASRRRCRITDSWRDACSAPGPLQVIFMRPVGVAGWRARCSKTRATPGSFRARVCVDDEIARERRRAHTASASQPS